MTIKAIKLSSTEGDINFLTRQFVGDRGPVYITRARRAINMLEERSLKAGRWFRKNFPKDIPFLSFKASEVKVIPEEATHLQQPANS